MTAYDRIVETMECTVFRHDGVVDIKLPGDATHLSVEVTGALSDEEAAERALRAREEALITKSER
jgi:hypothetical protein